METLGTAAGNRDTRFSSNQPHAASSARFSRRTLMLGGMAGLSAAIVPTVAGAQPSDTLPLPSGLQVDPEVRRRTTAEALIQDRWQQLGGSPGAAVTPGDSGLIQGAAGYFRDYHAATIFTTPDLTGTLLVYGSIRDRYRELGIDGSWLGWPTSDEQEYAEGGRVNTFQNGSIYWWPDTGPIDLNNIAVIYKGIHAFGEMDWDQGSGSDEMQAVFSFLSAVPGNAGSVWSAIQEGVDGGGTYPAEQVLYWGLPYGLSLTSSLFEVDFGGRENYQDKINGAVTAAGGAVATAAAAVPYVGPFLSLAVAGLVAEYGDDVGEWISDVLGLADDYLGADKLYLSPKELVLLPRQPMANFEGILYHRESALFSGGGGSWKLYYEIRGV